MRTILSCSGWSDMQHGDETCLPLPAQANNLRASLIEPVSRRLVQFGECVLFREPASKTGHKAQGKRAKKGDYPWTVGVWLGKTMKSDEHLVGASAGVQTARMVRRREAALQFEGKLLDELAGAHWDTKFGVGRPRGSAKVLGPQTSSSASSEEA